MRLIHLLIMNRIARDVIIQISKLATYLPRKCLRVLVRIVSHLYRDTRSLIFLFSLMSIAAFSRMLVNRATRVRIQAQTKARNALEY